MISALLLALRGRALLFRAKTWMLGGVRVNCLNEISFRQSAITANLGLSSNCLNDYSFRQLGLAAIWLLSSDRLNDKSFRRSGVAQLPCNLLALTRSPSSAAAMAPTLSGAYGEGCGRWKALRQLCRDASMRRRQTKSAPSGRNGLAEHPMCTSDKLATRPSPRPGSQLVTGTHWMP